MMRKKIISLIIIATLFLSFITLHIKTAEADSDTFVLWIVADPCGHQGSSYPWDMQVHYDGSSWSGQMIDSTTTHIDLAVLDTDIATPSGSGGGWTISQWRNFINTSATHTGIPYEWSKSADERHWAFLPGNHDIGSGDKNLQAMGKGLGLWTDNPSSEPWINWSTQWGTECNYTIQRGNLLFVFVSGDLLHPDDYSKTYGINYHDTIRWLRQQVHWAYNNSMNVIIFTHQTIWNGSQYINLNGGYHYVNYDSYWNKSTDWNKITTEPTHWFRCFHDAYYDDDLPFPQRGWNASDEFWSILNASWNAISIWVGSDRHNQPNLYTMHDYNSEYDMESWDSYNGTGRNIQKAPQCVFVDSLNAFSWTNANEGWTRIIQFTPNSKDILIRTFQHHGTPHYLNDADFYSSGKDIVIHDALKFPYDPEWPNSTNHSPTITLLQPADGATNVSINATLGVTIDDADNDSVTVIFYDASTNQPVGPS